MKLAKGGFSWISIAFIISSVFFSIFLCINSSWKVLFFFLTCLFLLISFLLLVFFRDPTRLIGSDIVAVADGFIQKIETIKDKDIGNCIRLTTFMNIHNVHVNRLPLTGTITQITHLPGGHLPAFTKDSERNERVIILVETAIGLVKIVQIAGTLARRIIPYVTEGKTLNKGEKIGLIRLGSRVDLYLPEKNINEIVVQKKQRIKAGVDTIATINA